MLAEDHVWPEIAERLEREQFAVRNMASRLNIGLTVEARKAMQARARANGLNRLKLLAPKREESLASDAVAFLQRAGDLPVYNAEKVHGRADRGLFVVNRSKLTAEQLFERAERKGWRRAA